MTITSRPYIDANDLKRMKTLLIDGRRVSPHSGYAHIGDIDWWLFYNPFGFERCDVVRLWEDSAGELLGWLFFATKQLEFSMFVHPTARGGKLEEQMVLYAEERLIETARMSGKPIQTDFVFEDDSARIALLERHGYLKDERDTFYFTQPLTVPIPEPQLPDGFAFLDAMREEYADKRAAVHFDAFNPSQMTADRYRTFMQAPEYNPILDTVVLAPDGQFASFVMGWIDPVNRISTFEPVGTHSAFRRIGLGRATLYEAMRRLKTYGVETATVFCEAGNIPFYRSAGFEIRNRMLLFKKAV